MIAFERAAFAYGATPILTDVSVTLEKGSFYFLTGPSGAGKTTFMRLCYRALKPDSGRITMFGEDTGDAHADAIANLRQRIGVVHQDCRFLDHLNVSDNIALPLEVSGGFHAGARRNLHDLLEWVGLEHRAEAFPPELSGGERQRAALARSLMPSPDVILADEPTGNIDAEMSDRLLGLLIELNRMGRTVVIATHDLGLIRSAKRHVAARVLRLSQGALSLAGADL